MSDHCCATNVEMSALALGTLPGAEAERLLAHLEWCASCQERAALHDRQSDGVVQALRGPAPTHYGDYEILAELAVGGMGQVFKARHQRMGRVVALKLLGNAIASLPQARERFAREAQLAARLRHPNTVLALDAGEQAGTLFLVTELIDGIDLNALVRQRGPLPIRQAVDAVVQAATGLEYIHQQGLVHRDVKPANLMLDAGGTVKVLDLGLARIADDHPDDPLTGTRMLLGTRDYLAPEQARDARTADQRADIYGLGCTLYFLLTGAPPYPAADDVAGLLAHQLAPIPRLRATRPEVSAQVEAVCRRMMAKDPAARPADMAQVIRHLRRAARASRSPRRLLGLAAAGVAGLVLASLVIPAVGTLAGWVKNAPRSPSNRPGGSGPLVSGPSEQMRAVSWRLRQLNPGFDGDIPFEVEGDMVRKVTVRADRLIDLSPLRVLTDLRVLKCEGTYPNRAPLNSLRPLRGLPLVELSVADTDVRDLGPLTGMALEKLSLRNTEVSSLAPLAGMKLTELDCTGTRVADLTPLQGMPLSRLEAYNTPARDLGPLAGAPLTSLNVGRTRVRDLTPLKGAPLHTLLCDHTAVTDLTPLKGMPLKLVRCEGSGVTDLTPLRGLRLEKLWCDVDATRDGDVLRGLTTLREINDLTPREFWAGQAEPRNP